MSLKVRFSYIFFFFQTNIVLKNVFLIALLCFTFLNLFEHVVPREKFKIHTPFGERACMHHKIIDRYFEKRKYWLTSNLGSILFKNEPLKYKQQDRIFTVLIWRHPWWKQSYVKDHHHSCSVKNCLFTVDENLLKKVDAVVVSTYTEHPWVHKRNQSQIWVFLTNESPFNTFASATDYSRGIKILTNNFNWSMTYRSDSEVPTPYFRTVPLPEITLQRMSSLPTAKIIPYWDRKQRDVLVVARISDCNIPARMNYLQELQKYIKVDIFGKCAETKEMKTSCPGYTDCPKIRNYTFYIAFERSRCRQYITEKVFHAFSKGAIPVVMGAPLSDYEKLLPPNSFLHVNSFDSPRDLAMEILTLSENNDHLESLHKWRHYFQVVNEHGTIGSEKYDLCRLCEALNFNDKKPKVYDLDALKLHLDPKLLCI